MFRFVLLSFIICMQEAFCYQEGYWRAYDGSVPDDAFVAGQDPNGKNIYVGQAYVVDGGMVPAQIYEGVKEVEVPWSGVYKTDQYINILCGPQENFKWLSTDAAHLFHDLVGKKAVLGGFYNGYGYYYIARIYIDGQTITGKIHQFSVDDPLMDFVVNHEELYTSSSYEVLYYDDSNLNANASTL